MTHTFQDVIDAIEAAERSLPVNAWTVGGIQVWPLVRVRLYFSGLKHDFDASHTRTRPRVELPKTMAKLAEIAQGRVRKAICSLRDSAGRARKDQPICALFVSDGVSFARFDGKWLERFCDPLIDKLRVGGVATGLWVPTHNYFTPRHSPSEWIQPDVDAAQLLGVLHSRMRGPGVRHLPGYADFLSLLSARGFATDDLEAGRICMDATRIAAVSDYFRRRLAMLRPRLVFIVSYYAIEGYSLVKACRDLDIPTVDLQHGVQGPLHPGYGRFSAAPTSGYDLLPDYFWSWSASEQSVITEWSSARRTRHKAIVGGNPWLETWLRGDSELVRRYDTDFVQLQRRTGAQRHVLVTLQFGLTFNSFLGPLAALARRVGPQWHWWIRLHPGMHGAAATIHQRLIDMGMSNFDVDSASQLPLYALLRHVDLHATYSSSVVLEAASFGVPSFVCSDAGADLFSQQIASGQARRLVLDGSAGVAELESFMRSPARVAGADQSSLSVAALLELCEMAGIRAAELQP